MKSRYLPLVGACGLVFMASLAHADQGWYISGQVGGSFLSDSELDDPTGILVALGTEADFDLGYNLSGALGYHWGKLRLEGEIAYAENDFDSLEVLGALAISTKGDLSSLGFMLNAFRDFEISGPWHVYLGGGVGLAIVSINDLSIVGTPLADDDDTVFAYQFGTGLGYRILPSTTLTLDYRFFSTLDPEFQSVGGLQFEADYDSHDIRIGVRFTF